jgi:prophage antirepressor-like protein
MNAIQLFNFEGSPVETIVHEETKEVWVVAKDICDILDIKNVTQALESLDEDEKLTYLLHRAGQKREMYVINESGVYALILSSRKPDAKRLRKWVTSEVLPTIRKTGGYGVDKQAVDALNGRVERLESLLQGESVSTDTSLTPSRNSAFYMEIEDAFNKSASRAFFAIIEAVNWAKENGLKELEAYQIKKISRTHIDYAQRLLPYANRLLTQ